MKSSFIDLGISPPILSALEKMGFESPTEVQSKAIPHVLNQEDLIVMSKTGSGKTAVFGIPMLQMTDPEAAGSQGLILTPTRELAVQVDSDLKRMAMNLQHRTTAVFGQHSMNVEIQALTQGATIVTGTPGRVFDHIRHGHLVTAHIRFLVLDEADRMLDMGFLEQVERIIRTLPRNRTTLLFSATIPSEVHKICREYMKHPVTISIASPTKTVDVIEQAYYRVERNEKNTQLNRLLLVEQPESCMIFCNTRIGVDRVQSFLTRKGYASQALHGDIPQSKRLQTIHQFKQGEFHLLVATDVAARGIHIDDLSLVINYDVPVEKDSYVHRIGRTGRAGNTGRAISLVTSEDIMSLYAIEEHIGALIKEAELPPNDVFNARRAEADDWIKANAPKSKPPQAVPAPKANEGQKKPSHGKRPSPSHGKNPHTSQALPQRNSTHARQPSPVEKNESAKQTTPLEKTPYEKRPIRQNRQSNRPAGAPMDQKAAQRPHSSHTARPPRPAHIADRPVQSPPAEVKAPQRNPLSETVEVHAPAEKKPLFQRLFQRILGRKDA